MSKKEKVKEKKLELNREERHALMLLDKNIFEVFRGISPECIDVVKKLCDHYKAYSVEEDKCLECGRGCGFTYEQYCDDCEEKFDEL